MRTAAPIADRFYRHVDKRETGCWIWLGATAGAGEGTFRVAGGVKAAHRVAWMLLHGQYPDGWLWRCRTDQRCIRPEHCKTDVPEDVKKSRRKMWRRR